MLTHLHTCTHTHTHTHTHAHMHMHTHTHTTHTHVDIGPYTVTASSQKYPTISLTDVLFGDVWLCSGQSNMQFTVPQVFNASVEIADAANYPDIRLFTACKYIMPYVGLCTGKYH